MNTESSATEAVVRNHLQAFLEQKGIAAIVNDYDETARLYSEAEIYRGKQEIGDFFTDFIDCLPAGAIGRFSLRSLRVDDDIAYITWSVGSEIPLGTDTFVVNNGKIVSQTFAMYAVPATRSRFVPASPRRALLGRAMTQRGRVGLAFAHASDDQQGSFRPPGSNADAGEGRTQLDAVVPRRTPVGGVRDGEQAVDQRRDPGQGPPLITRLAGPLLAAGPLPSSSASRSSRASRSLPPHPARAVGGQRRAPVGGPVRRHAGSTSCSPAVARRSRSMATR